LLSQGIDCELADVIASLKDLLFVPIASSAHDRDWCWQVVWLRIGLMICRCFSGSATLIQQTCAFDQHICISLVCAAPCTNPRSIPSLQRRLNVIKQRLDAFGAQVTAAISNTTSTIPATTTHIVIRPPEDGAPKGAAATGSSSSDNDSNSGAGPAGVSTQGALGWQATANLGQLLHQVTKQQGREQQRPAVVLVSDAWLDAVLQAGQHVPEEQYNLHHLLQPSLGLNSSSDGEGRHIDRSAAGGVLVRRMPVLDPAPDAPMGR
jgi:hypothetical protein